MITLALDTTGPWCTAALVDRSSVLAQRSEKIGRGHAEHLAPMVQDILGQANMTAGAVERLSVCTGPGSFTGLRVALAFARAFALPRNLPTIGLSALDVIAAMADPGRSQSVLSIIDVRRDEVCWALYENGICVQPAQTDFISDARTAAGRLSADLIIGDGAALIGAPASATYVDGAVLGWLSQDKDPGTYPAAPLYSRPPDAKLPGGRTLT